MSTTETVLVVDDEENIRHALERLFRSAGFAVRTYASGDEFLAGYRPGGDECLILDLRMPHMGGLELQEEMRRRGIDVPVIFYTGYGDVPATVRAMQWGAVEVIEKPCSGEILIEHVRHALQQGRALRAQHDASRAARARLATLTPREREIAEQVADGLTATEIGRRLHISPRTVETHRVRAFGKMGVCSAPELAKLLVIGGLGDQAERR